MNIITKKNDKTNVIAFDIEATCSHPEFEKYFRLRESNEKISPERWEARFDADLCKHFEIAYSLLKKEDN